MIHACRKNWNVALDEINIRRNCLTSLSLLILTVKSAKNKSCNFFCRLKGCICENYSLIQHLSVFILTTIQKYSLHLSHRAFMGKLLWKNIKQSSWFFCRNGDRTKNYSTCGCFWHVSKATFKWLNFGFGLIPQTLNHQSVTYRGFWLYKDIRSLLLPESWLSEWLNCYDSFHSS